MTIEQEIWSICPIAWSRRIIKPTRGVAKVKLKFLDFFSKGTKVFLPHKYTWYISTKNDSQS